MLDKAVHVTKPALPPLKELLPYLCQIWEGGVLTNCGPFHQQLEENLCNFLGVEHVSLFTNGTVALITALKALGIKGEVITTPYSFVATTNALYWNGLQPVFVDIDPETCNLDPLEIEGALTERTTAILPVHCYGRPCDVTEIGDIAKKHNLRLIYDGAHAFGVFDERGSILRHGDLTAVSFHATKVFNTFEGGAIISPDAQTKRHIDHLKNFGFEGETHVIAPGINGKMSEFNSALGLLQLKYIESQIAKRREIDTIYRTHFSAVRGIGCAPLIANIRANYAYFPILVGDDYPLRRDELYDRLKDHNIFARRYFYPTIADFPIYRSLPSAAPGRLPVARNIAARILCLPIYPELNTDIVGAICDLIGSA